MTLLDFYKAVFPKAKNYIKKENGAYPDIFPCQLNHSFKDNCPCDCRICWNSEYDLINYTVNTGNYKVMPKDEFNDMLKNLNVECKTCKFYENTEYKDLCYGCTVTGWCVNWKSKW